MTARELGALMGRSEESVRCARKRHGRYSRSGHAGALCVVCDERVVWEETPEARSMHLCKGCYLREMRARKSEELASNALRQRRYKEKKRRLRNRGKK